MKRASYRQGVEYIALNDNDGGSDRLEVDSIAGYISTVLLADLFDVLPERVARDIIRYRLKYSRVDTKSRTFTEDDIPF